MARHLPAVLGISGPAWHPETNVWPVLRSRMFSRASRSMATPETAAIRSRVVSRDSDPTVTATPTVTCLMMMARARAPFPFEPTCTGSRLRGQFRGQPGQVLAGGVPGRPAPGTLSRSWVRPAA